MKILKNDQMQLLSSLTSISKKTGAAEASVTVPDCHVASSKNHG